LKAYGKTSKGVFSKSKSKTQLLMGNEAKYSYIKEAIKIAIGLNTEFEFTLKAICKSYP
jgi:hypothetical protein